MKKFMGMNKGLTKQDLEQLGITKVTKDGHIFVGSRELKHSMTVKVRKYGYIGKYYNSNVTIKKKTFTVGRVMLAWFYGCVPQGTHCDHIDRDSLNNNLSNLRFISPRGNNYNRTYDYKFINNSTQIIRQMMKGI